MLLKQTVARIKLDGKGFDTSLSPVILYLTSDTIWLEELPRTPFDNEENVIAIMHALQTTEQRDIRAAIQNARCDRPNRHGILFVQAEGLQFDACESRLLQMNRGCLFGLSHDKTETLTARKGPSTEFFLRCTWKSPKPMPTVNDGFPFNIAPPAPGTSGWTFETEASAAA